ncbi:MAG TPA: hypothetical protein VFP34_03765 [Microlunatus sp.]|nr:hypothetical protein [Microlunatus sp.]
MDVQLEVSPVWLVPPMVPGVVIRSRCLAGSSFANWQAARASAVGDGSDGEAADVALDAGVERVGDPLGEQAGEDLWGAGNPAEAVHLVGAAVEEGPGFVEFDEPATAAGERGGGAQHPHPDQRQRGN